MNFSKRITQNGLLFIVGLMLIGVGCKKDDGMNPKDPDDPNENTEYSLGYNAENENLDEIPSDINISFGNENLPSSMDISQYFPPIGDQGEWGTCVTWTLAYNLKTSLDALDENYNLNDLSDAGKQMSPKDLFWAIPQSNKGENCSGTNFEPAFDILMDRGVASMDLVPYESLEV